MAQAEKTETTEPTMEEILASIRRIISEDGATVQAAPPPEEGVLDLTDLLEDEKPAAMPSPAPSDLEVVMEDNVPETPAAAMPSAPVASTAPAVTRMGDDRLISDVTAQAAASVLSGALSSPRPGGMETPMGNGARTLESMVLEIIRPVLKDWLDRNLPSLVERIVTKEVRKITRDIG